MRGFYNAATLLMGTVELSGDDIIYVSDNRVTAAFFGTSAGSCRALSDAGPTLEVVSRVIDRS